MSEEYLDQSPYSVIRQKNSSIADVVKLIIDQRDNEKTIDAVCFEVDRILVEKGQKPYFKNGVACVEPTDYSVEKIYVALLTGFITKYGVVDSDTLTELAEKAVAAAKILKETVEEANKGKENVY